MKLKLNNFTLLNYLYYSCGITKGLKLLLITGKKETAENYTSKLFKYIKIQYGLYPYFLFNDFLVKNKLGVIIKQYRKSNIFYEVPFPMDIERQYKQSMRGMLITVRTQRKVSFQSTLLSEITDFLKEKTSLLQKRNSEQLQILVKSRLYQQYRW